jgi:3-dehydroquinate dehydratase II
VATTRARKAPSTAAAPWLGLPVRPVKKPRQSLRILVLSGPNLNLLGTREPAVYGQSSLATIERQLADLAGELGARVVTRQSNHEGELCTWIGQAPSAFDGIVINPAAYTHTSVALLDAVRAINIPCVEVHLSNPQAREAFRRRSYLARGCLGVISGFGPDSYLLGLRALVTHLRSTPPSAG